jgi:hypothetical protein
VQRPCNSGTAGTVVDVVEVVDEVVVEGVVVLIRLTLLATLMWDRRSNCRGSLRDGAGTGASLTSSSTSVPNLVVGLRVVFRRTGPDLCGFAVDELVVVVADDALDLVFLPDLVFVASGVEDETSVVVVLGVDEVDVVDDTSVGLPYFLVHNF